MAIQVPHSECVKLDFDVYRVSLCVCVCMNGMSGDLRVPSSKRNGVIFCVK